MTVLNLGVILCGTAFLKKKVRAFKVFYLQHQRCNIGNRITHVNTHSVDIVHEGQHDPLKCQKSDVGQ